MEDRYLFKGKEKDSGKWVTWNIFSGLYGHDIDKSTICQCTGLRDKNGKLIWENDIVWDSDERAFYEIIWNQEDMCWNVEDADGHKSEFEECYGSTIEVNGNRFDNPELLESEE